MATCFGHPCDHHQANFYRSCALNVLTIWDPIMCTSFLYIWTKITVKTLTVILVHIYKNSIYVTVKTFNSDLVHI